MSKTLTIQTNHAFRTIADGDAVHTHIGHDMVFGLNNLVYCSPFFGHCSSPGAWPAGPSLLELNAATSGESFIAQVPAYLPRDAYRFCWTLNIRHGIDPAEFGYSDYAHEVSIDEVNIYISPTPYTGTVISTGFVSSWGGGLYNQDTFFDVTKLGQNYGISQYTTPIVCAASTQVDKFVDMSAGTADPAVWMPFDTRTSFTSSLNLVYLVVTLERHTTDSAALNAPGGAGNGEKLRLNDFSWWVEYE